MAKEPKQPSTKSSQRDAEKSPDALRFGENLRDQRQGLRLTLDGMSRLTKLVDDAGAGVSRVALSRYENGDSMPGLRELKLISKALRLPLSSLVYGDSDDPMNFLPPSIELALEAMIAQIVDVELTKRGVVGDYSGLFGMKDSDRFTDRYESLLERARQGDE